MDRFHFCSDSAQIVLGSHKLVHVDDSEFFILFQSYLKDFPKASPRKYGPAMSRFTSKEAVQQGGSYLWRHKW